MSSKPRTRVSPLVILSLGILATSTASIFIRFVQEDASSLVIAAWRLGFATLILAPLAAARRRDELARLRGSALGLALLAGVFLAVHFVTWISSLAYTSVASSVVLVDTAPLWVALAAPLVLKERIPRPVWVGLGLALAGGVLVALSDGCLDRLSGLTCPSLAEFRAGRAILGDGLALIGAVTAAAYLLIGRQVRTRVSLLSYIFLVYGMSAVVLVILVWAGGIPMFGYSPAVFGWFLLLALIPQLLGHTSYNWALGYLSAAYVSLTLLGEPVGSTLLAYLLLGETPGPLKLAGGALILVGLLAASRREG